MANTSTTDKNARMYTTHGAKRNQGQLAMVNQKIALAYVERLQGRDHLVGYTYIDEMMKKACSTQLPEYTVDF